jgi:uncharacterized protein YjbJ (UPF0337 family)
MGSKMDDSKGRLKQAIGDITDNDKLHREGTADRAGGKAKAAADRGKAAVSGGIDAVKEKLQRRT